MGAPIKYGYVQGGENNLPFEVSTSTVFKHKGGSWVVLDSSNQIDIAGATDTNILGWAYTGDLTSDSSETPLVTVNVCREAVYEMPLDAARTETQLKALLHETGDIIVTSNIQYFDYDASAIDILEVVGYRYYGSASGEQSVLTRLYLPNLTAKGGVA